jgi:hypothetical protein
MECTFDTVLRLLVNPSIASGTVSRSPSPSSQTVTTQALMRTPSPPPPPEEQHLVRCPPPPSSPKLHSLPDNSLNPFGLLAEASLANRCAQLTKPAAALEDHKGSTCKPSLDRVFLGSGMLITIYLGSKNS